tara:strand:- start:309 stop:1487 length:1179 start_codon:yes stop_codon:yes gene_type:complete
LGRSFIKSRNYRNTKRRDKTTPEFYASAVFRGLSFSNDFQDRIDFDRPIRFNPEITLLEGNTRALINFNGCKDDLENEYIDQVINGLSMGNGFTLSNAQHIDSISGEISNISAGFTAGSTFDKAIFAHVYTVTSPQNYDKKYKAEGFVKDTEFDFSAITSSNTNESNAIKNLFGRNLSPSFETIGVKFGDTVRIESGSNTGKIFNVTGTSIDSEEMETLVFGASADFVEESRLNQDTRLSFFRIDTERSTLGGDITVNGNVVVLSPQIQNGAFRFGDTEQPTLRMQVGNTYIFDLSSALLLQNDLLFRISTTVDGKWNGGTVHPDIKICGDVLVFYPENKGTFYYYSENKPNSGGIIQISDTAPELQSVSGTVLAPSSTSFDISRQTNVTYY